MTSPSSRGEHPYAVWRVRTDISRGPRDPPPWLRVRDGHGVVAQKRRCFGAIASSSTDLEDPLAQVEVEVDVRLARDQVVDAGGGGLGWGVGWWGGTTMVHRDTQPTACHVASVEWRAHDPHAANAGGGATVGEE